MQLKDTIQLMNSENYKDRFVAEYLQLIVRIKGLEKMLVKYRYGKLNFIPKCSYELLNAQLKTMEDYKFYLEIRAKIEGIELGGYKI